MQIKLSVPSSKSLTNRYLILRQGYDGLDLNWSTEARDVLLLEKALKSLDQTIDVGQGGTTFRFICLYLSTLKGSWKIKAAKSLLIRPQGELYECLKILGTTVVQESEELIRLDSTGWSVQKIKVDALDTTQVVTGLILAALASKQSLEININSKGLNSGYLELTKNFVESLGFRVDFSTGRIFVHKGQTPLYMNGGIEGDWSTAAFLYTMAALKGRADLSNLSEESIQPDSKILAILQSSGVSVDRLEVLRNNIDKPYEPVRLNIQSCPDLFPVLSVFSCFCDGESHLYGAPQLKFKESDRILEMESLLIKCGYKVEAFDDGLKIHGEGALVLEHAEFDFDVSKDHRIFMACEILKKMGYRINIIGGGSIQKSFPEYLTMDLGC